MFTGTNWTGSSAVHAPTDPAYDPARAALMASFGTATPGDAAATRPAILQLVDEAEPPLRVIFGKGAFDIMRTEYRRRIATWEQ
jgi:hypothetical protein